MVVSYDGCRRGVWYGVLVGMVGLGWMGWWWKSGLVVVVVMAPDHPSRTPISKERYPTDKLET